MLLVILNAHGPFGLVCSQLVTQTMSNVFIVKGGAWNVVAKSMACPTAITY